MYVKTTNGVIDQYPYTIGDLRRDNPNTSFPKNIPTEILQSYGIFLVTVDESPEFSHRTQKVEQESLPTLSDGTWSVGWTVNDKSEEEIAAYDTAVGETVRAERDQKLADTDFYALSDVTMSTEMATYRQALRDITDHANFPNLDADDWPVKP